MARQSKPKFKNNANHLIVCRREPKLKRFPTRLSRADYTINTKLQSLLIKLSKTILLFNQKVRIIQRTWATTIIIRKNLLLTPTLVCASLAQKHSDRSTLETIAMSSRPRKISHRCALPPACGIQRWLSNHEKTKTSTPSMPKRRWAQRAC